jgi:hypothetical protein
MKRLRFFNGKDGSKSSHIEITNEDNVNHSTKPNSQPSLLGRNTEAVT